MNILRFFQNSFTTAALFLVLMFVFSYQTVYAQGSLSDPGSTLRQIEQRGIVPCATSNTTMTCKLCDIFKLTKNLTDFFIYAGLAVTSAFIGYGGFMILAGSYSEEKTRHGKEILTSAVTGLLILLFAWLIVDTAIKVMVNSSVSSIIGSGASSAAGEFPISNLGPWNAVNCAAFEPSFAPTPGGTTIDLNNLF